MKLIVTTPRCRRPRPPRCKLPPRRTSRPPRRAPPETRERGRGPTSAEQRVYRVVHSRHIAISKQNSSKEDRPNIALRRSGTVARVVTSRARSSARLTAAGATLPPAAVEAGIAPESAEASKLRNAARAPSRRRRRAARRRAPSHRARSRATGSRRPQPAPPRSPRTDPRLPPRRASGARSSRSRRRISRRGSVVLLK